MKKLAKLFAAVLAIAMVITMLPCNTAQAASNYVFVNGTKTKVTKDKPLTIWVGGKKSNLDYMINNKSVGISGKWTSSKPKVVKVDAKTGVVQALKNGTAVITFKAKNGTTVKGTVRARTRSTYITIRIEGGNASGALVDMEPNETKGVTLVHSVNDKASKANCKSSYYTYCEIEDPSVVSFIKNDDSSFALTALKEGTTKVTFVANYTKEKNVRNNKYYVEQSCTIKVAPKEEEATWSASQTAVNKITVKGKGLTSVASDYKVLRDNVPVAISSAIAANDGKSAVLTTTSANPMSGKYTVSFKNGDAMAFDVKPSTPSKAEISDGASIVTGNSKKATFTYKIYDQFGTDVTAKAFSSLQFTVSPGTADTTKAGIVTVTSTTDYVANQSMFTAVIISRDGTLSESKVLKVGPAASPCTVKVLGVYKLDGANYSQTSLYEGTYTASQVYLALEVRDQYNSIYPASALSKDNLVVTVAGGNGLLFDTDSKPISLKANGNEFAAGYPCKAGTVKEGTVNIIAVPINFSGAKTTNGEGKVNVLASAKVATFTCSPMSTLKVGSKTEFSFAAADTNGKAITDYELLKNVSFTMSTGVSMSFVKQANGTAKLYGIPNTANIVVISLSPTGQVDSKPYTAVEKSVPTSVFGFTSDAVTGAVPGGIINIPLKSIKVMDQYGAQMTVDEIIASYADGYAFAINFGSGVAYVADNGSNVKPMTADATLVSAKALAAGSNTVTVSLIKGSNPVAGSDYSQALYCAALASLSSFSADVPSLVYAPGAPTDLAITVYGVYGGQKVKLAATDYVVYPGMPNLTNDSNHRTPGEAGVTPGTVRNPGFKPATDKSAGNDFTYAYKIIINDGKGSSVDFNVRYSETAPYAVTCDLKSADAHLNNHTVYTASDIINMFNFKDQYGQPISYAGARIQAAGYTTNAVISGNGTASFSIKDADTTLTLYITNGIQMFTKQILVY